MSEELIVDFASPTLAGIKTGSLFSGECGGKEELSEFAARMNRRLTPHGLRLMPLRFNEKRALMYIYRPERLREDLDDPLAKEILGALGYPLESADAASRSSRKECAKTRLFRTRSDFSSDIRQRMSKASSPARNRNAQACGKSTATSTPRSQNFTPTVTARASCANTTAGQNRWINSSWVVHNTRRK